MPKFIKILLEGSIRANTYLPGDMVVQIDGLEYPIYVSGEQGLSILDKSNSLVLRLRGTWTKALKTPEKKRKA